MKIQLWFALAALSIAGVARAEAQQDDVTKAPSCNYCGMDRAKYAQSRMLIHYEDGTSVGLCSLHCAAVELAVAIDKVPTSILVADRASRRLIAAEKAVWVLGGNVPGVMTARAKWAFEDRAEAEAFVRTSGGAIATFDDVMKATYEDMYQDTRMIREKRRMKRLKAPEAGASTRR